MEEKLQEITIGKAVIISVVMAAVYYFVLYNDGSVLESSIASTQTQIQEKQVELERINKAIKDAERFKAMAKNLGDEMGQVLNAMPEKVSEMDLMRIMSNEAKTIGLNIARIAPVQSRGGAGGEESPYYEVVAVNVSFEGSYNQVMILLSNLTKQDKIITASDLTLNTKPTGAPNTTGAPANPRVELKGEFRAYRYKAPKSDQAGAA